MQTIKKAMNFIKKRDCMTYNLNLFKIAQKLKNKIFNQIQHCKYSIFNFNETQINLFS